jgi:hypothetical protein
MVGLDDNFNTTTFFTALVLRGGATTNQWILRCLRRAVGDDTISNLRVVATDGDDSFPAALQAELPAVRHIRAYCHIIMKLEERLRAPLGERMDAFMTMFQTAVHQREVRCDRMWPKSSRKSALCFRKLLFSKLGAN